VNGKDVAVQGAALGALGKIHEQPDLVVPVLIKYLDDGTVNTQAAEALAGFGAVAKAAVPKLIPLLKVQDKDLHHAVVVALRKIDSAAAAQAGAK
jgi:HEAT repeat protein